MCNDPTDEVDAARKSQLYGDLNAKKGKKLIKMVLVGDDAVGKTSLVTNYLKNKYSENYVKSTVLDVYRGVKNVNKNQIHTEIHVTSGGENFVKNRKVQY